MVPGMTETAELDTPPASVEPEVLSIAEAQKLIPPLPLPNPSAIQAEEARQDAATPPPVEKPPASTGAKASRAAYRDARGKLHDPRIHETNPDGSPALRLDGKTIKMRKHPLKDWKAQSRVVYDEPAPVVDPQVQMASEAREMEMEASAATLAGLQLMMMKAALGEKIGDEEAQRVELIRSWKRVFVHYGMGELHPVVGLAMVTGGIVVTGLQHEDTRTRFQKLSNWFQHRMLSVWQWLTGKRKPRPVLNGDDESNVN